jgi:hypothetical protein
MASLFWHLVRRAETHTAMAGREAMPCQCCPMADDSHAACAAWGPPQAAGLALGSLGTGVDPRVCQRTVRRRLATVAGRHGATLRQRRRAEEAASGVAGELVVEGSTGRSPRSDDVGGPRGRLGESCGLAGRCYPGGRGPPARTPAADLVGRVAVAARSRTCGKLPGSRGLGYGASVLGVTY